MFDLDSHLIFEAYLNGNNRYWMNPSGSLRKVTDHLKSGAEILEYSGYTDKDIEKLMYDPHLIYEILFDLKYIRIAIDSEKSILYFENDEKEISQKQLKELKDFAIENNLKLINGDFDEEIPLNESTNILYVCANCEQEFGKVQTDKDKSHGICKRHLIEMYRKLGMIENAQEIENRPDSSFNCPDLAKQQIQESIDWKQKLQNLPETGMGYQKVVFTLKDGRKVLATVFNRDQIKTNLKFKIDDIVDVTIQKKSENNLPNWAENLAGSKPDNYTGNQKINYI